MGTGARGIQSIEVSGRILNVLIKTSKPVMLKEIAHDSQLAPAQCHAYLTSLRHVGLVHQDSDSGLYRMGPLATRLGIGWLKGSPAASTAIHTLKALTDELGALSVIVLWSGEGATIVHLNVGTQRTALNLRQGTLFSVTGTATGRVFAAFGDPELIRSNIEQEFNGPDKESALGSFVSRDSFNEQVDLIRKKGYAIAKGAPIPGINAIACPVFGVDQKLEMVVTLIGTADGLDVSEESDAIPGLLSAATEIGECFKAQGKDELSPEYPSASKSNDHEDVAKG